MWESDGLTKKVEDCAAIDGCDSNYITEDDYQVLNDIDCELQIKYFIYKGKEILGSRLYSVDMVL